MMKNLARAMLVASAYGAKFLNATEPVEGSYIVVLHKGAHMAKHLSTVRAYNFTIAHEYSIGDSFRGYHTFTDAAGLEKLGGMAEVDWIEQDGVVRTNQDGQCKQQKNAVWGLARTSSRAPGASAYQYNTFGEGEGVTVYVIDTGVLSTHDEFEGRASSPAAANFISGETSDDLNGHGTHCAGTIAGRTYGVAKRATVIGVKVLGGSGTGTNAGVIGGVNYAAKGKGAVLSMSLGGGSSAALDAAVGAAADNGNHVVVASGNSNEDACGSSPARAGGTGGKIISVNAQTDQDARSSFSNFGRCTDLFAPGSSITSAWIGSNTATNTISGTSMACPHVAGMMAKYASSPAGQGATPAVAKEWLLTAAVQTDAIKGPGTNTPNKLLTADCDEFNPQ